jgi:predicted HicB family RNase H-like nuclease
MTSQETAGGTGVGKAAETSPRRDWKQMSLRVPPHVHAAIKEAADESQQRDIDWVRETIVMRLTSQGKLQ